MNPIKFKTFGILNSVKWQKLIYTIKTSWSNKTAGYIKYETMKNVCCSIYRTNCIIDDDVSKDKNVMEFSVKWNYSFIFCEIKIRFIGRENSIKH